MSIGLAIVIVVVALVAVNVVLWLLFSGKKDQGAEKGTELILQQLNDLRREMDTKLGESGKTVHESLKTQLTESSKFAERAQKTQSELVREITELKETNKQVVSYSDQLRVIQDILKNPKQRGTIVGEYYLETILQRVLPPSTYQTQYKFKNGEIVDAVVFVKDTIIPIDSKFSLENYNRIIEANQDSNSAEPFVQEFKKDVKKRIDETSKYIRPEENTLDFAFMFIPHEAIYYDLLVSEVGAVKLNTQDLMEYAFQKKVIIVSPTSFLAYLQTVLQGLKSLQIEDQARDIQKRVGELGRHLSAHNEFMLKLGSALGTTVNHYNKAHKELGKIDKDVVRISGESPEIETLTLEKPNLDE